MLHQHDESSDLGIVKITDKAISSIASIAAIEISGVSSLGRATAIASWLTFKKCSPIRVSIDKNQEVHIKVPLVVKYGYNIPDVAGKVQENVRNALEKMTDLTLRDIDIIVLEIEKE
ncbi:MAG: Asp23/Gls24 family envelope stress response protein [Candidatus Omnitrophota bacterium]|nr:Asp23/Gls24 family envelope stress response protein [Candidatus Omnitrophota bacterium]